MTGVSLANSYTFSGQFISQAWQAVPRHRSERTLMVGPSVTLSALSGQPRSHFLHPVQPSKLPLRMRPTSSMVWTPPPTSGMSDFTTLTTFFGGTSLLIVVGVALDTLRRLESQLVMRNFDGFLKHGRITGRR